MVSKTSEEPRKGTMTDQTNPSHGGNEHDGDAANAPAADFGAPADQSQQPSTPAEQSPYAAPADQGQQFSAPAEQNPYAAPAADFGAPAQQNPYGSAPADQGQYSAPADQGQQFSAPAEQSPYGAPADQGQQYSAPAEQNPYGSAPTPGYGSAPADQGQYGAPAGGYGSAPADQGQYAAPGQPNYGAPAGDQYGQGNQYGAPGQGGQYGAPGQPQYGAPGYATQMSPHEEVENSKNAHMFSAIGAIFNVGWIVALIFYLINKDKGAFVRQESAASLNFQISIAIYFWASYIIGFVLLFIFIGALFFLVSLGAWLMGFICAFMMASKVGNGGSSNYPLTIKMVK